MSLNEALHIAQQVLNGTVLPKHERERAAEVLKNHTPYLLDLDHVVQKRIQQVQK